jgi:hypothetical protein
MLIMMMIMRKREKVEMYIRSNQSAETRISNFSHVFDGCDVHALNEMNEDVFHGSTAPSAAA